MCVFFKTILTVFLFWHILVSSDLTDSLTVFARTKAYEQYQSAMSALHRGDIAQCLKLFESSYTIHKTFHASNKMGWLHHMLGSAGKSKQWFQAAAQLEPADRRRLLEEGIAAHFAQDYSGAVRCFDQLLAADPAHEMALYNKAVTLQHTGDVQGSAQLYARAVAANPLDTRSLLNLAVLHHRYGSLRDAQPFYERAQAATRLFMSAAGGGFLHAEFAMTRSNLGALHLQLGALQQAYDTTTGLISELTAVVGTSCHASLDAPSLATCTELRRSVSTAHGILSNIQRSAVYWRDWETVHSTALGDSLTAARNLQRPYAGPLLPFDTLMLQVSLPDRLHIAAAASRSYLTAQHKDASSPVRSGRSLRLGFLSFDFADHPTAHLVEGLFSVLRADRDRAAPDPLFRDTELRIYSYGPDDSSIYRTRLRALADQFVELAHLPHAAAAETIRRDDLAVLLDMQMHTLGGRMEIAALSPAPLQVSYLVFPGTSGARFFQYLLADAVVAPAEHAPHYSEALLLLPPSYQVSFYDRYEPAEAHRALFGDVAESGREREMVAALRRVNGLPAGQEDIVLCNFNKVDKIDPETFATWMAILRRVPRSYLWLVEPTSRAPTSSSDGVRDEASARNALVKDNICRAASFAGVSCSRIVYAARTDKASHILRHAAADLFLDSGVYGAHSTATDALRGNLPVLTTLGDSFPSRVGASLYASFDSDRVLSLQLVAHSRRDFEDRAVRLVGGGRAGLGELRREVERLITGRRGLFDTRQSVRSFVRGMQVLQDLRDLALPGSREQQTASLAREKYHAVVLSEHRTKHFEQKKGYHTL